ncbi:alginate export family protein [Brevundimonas sp.]|uniref:alginate export family protein n=1 Tax=Brevundimonas sp. TaxID=1871086 RepID=UPI0026278D4C|nr:alginate export family protein [Brevundimonas sp.]
MTRLGRAFGITVLLNTLAVGTGVHAQTHSVPCAPKAFRWQEDCRPIDGEARSRFRYLPLAGDASSWLTLGGEFRVRIESIDRPTYGLTPAPGYSTADHRFLLHADAREVSGLRGFVQLSAVSSAGRFPVRSVDRSEVDLQQGFIDIPLGSPQSILRIGRQEFDGDGLRLISSRDSANLRRAFDMVQLDLRPGQDRLSIFYGSPVGNHPGVFDDHPVSGETLLGVIVRHGWTMGTYHGTFGGFAIERKRPQAIFQDARGAERRDTLGLRLSGDAPSYRFALAGGLQIGTVGASEISAHGLSGEAFYKTRLGQFPASIGATFGIASGDRRSDDGTVGTFDPLYPNLGYYTDAAVSYPANVWDIEPQVSIQATSTLDVQVGVDLTSRLSRHDAVYQSGVPRLLGTGQEGSFLGSLFSVKAAWTPTANLTLTTSYVHGAPGAVIEEAGGKTFDFAYGQLAYRY